MSAENLPAKPKPSFLLRLSGPLCLLGVAVNLIGVVLELKTTSTAGTIAHGVVIVVFAIIGIFLWKRYRTRK